MQRRLTVILLADVVGYSALMERDEEGTLARLKRSRAEAIEPAIRDHGGRIVKLMGDGILVEFSSVVSAVEGARQIQHAVAQLGRTDPDAEPLLYRIGINLGDVIADGDDLYGDGVNIAARLQALAQPGGVVVSSTVFDQAAGRVAATFADLGEHAVKNIERPIRVYAVESPAAPAAEAAKAVGICVLPFANMSGDPEQAYFSDGVSEDIITDLSKVSALSVTARNSAFAFRAQNVDVRQIARKLVVAYVLEGSVRKVGNRVRITAQLVDGATGNHLWAERYDRDLNDIFALQDEISQAIVAALKLKLLPEEKRAIGARSTTNLEAYEVYLMARQLAMSGQERHRETTVRLCRRAVELDPNYARAWALLAISLANMRVFVLSESDNGGDAARRALALDPDLAEAHSAIGRILSESGDHETGWTEHKRALELDPSSYDVNAAAARCAIFRRAWDEAIPLLENAARIVESDIWALGMAVQCYDAKGDEPGARSAAQGCLVRVESQIATEPDNGVALGFGITSLVRLGETDRAKTWIRRALLLSPDNLRLRYNVACALVTLNEHDWALDLFEPIINTATAEVVRYFKVDASVDALRGYPRYQQCVAEAEARLALA
jgi:adenylate cyclase